MGNRALITSKKRDMAIYLHWNGGRDSVEAFLKYCELRGFRTPESNDYGWARLCQVIANFFGADGLSIGIHPYSGDECDVGDNGTYIIEGWKIVGRLHYDWEEQHEYELDDMLIEIDEAQPPAQQLGRDYLLAKEVPAGELKMGDEVYVTGMFYGVQYVALPVLGFNRRRPDDEPLPYVDYFGDGNDNVLDLHATNPNIYLDRTRWDGTEIVYRVKR